MSTTTDPLTEFNSLSTEECITRLSHCVSIPSWSTYITSQRPFTSIESILDIAQKQANTWTWDEIKGALDTHPRIGEKKATVELSSAEAAFSNKEQGGITIDEQTQEALYKGNVAYEERFGWIFLVRAAGRSKEDILQLLNERLKNNDDDEKIIVKDQLIQIAFLRLTQQLQ